MSIQYHVKIEDLKGEIPFDMFYQESCGVIPIGTNFKNGNREAMLEVLMKEKETGEQMFHFPNCETIEELQSSDKPYYSKWNRKSPIEFFDTVGRFSFYIIPETSDPNQDRAEAAIAFLDSILDDDTPIFKRYVEIDPVLRTWGDLKKAFNDPNGYMQPSGQSQGVYRVPKAIAEEMIEERDEEK